MLTFGLARFLELVILRLYVPHQPCLVRLLSFAWSWSAADTASPLAILFAISSLQRRIIWAWVLIFLEKCLWVACVNAMWQRCFPRVSTYDMMQRKRCQKEICTVKYKCARIAQKRGCARNPIVLVGPRPRILPYLFLKFLTASEFVHGQAYDFLRKYDMRHNYFM